MKTGDDPTARPRLDKERQNDRDTEIWRMKQRGMSLAELGDELGMPRSSVEDTPARLRGLCVTTSAVRSTGRRSTGCGVRKACRCGCAGK